MRKHAKHSILVMPFLFMGISFCLLIHAWPGASRGDHTSQSEAAQQSTTPTTTSGDRLLDSMEHSVRHVYGHLVKSTAYIEAMDDAGVVWSGTGWLLDRDRRLMVTNKHVVSPDDQGEVKSLFAWFPTIRDEEAVHDIDFYVQNVAKVNLKVIMTDAKRDLAIAQLESLPDEAQALQLATKSPRSGERLHSLAGFPRGSQGLFIYTEGIARAVYRRNIALGEQIRVLETQMPLNQGNSGGPILNDQADVVAVFQGLMTEPGVQLVNMCIDLSEVREFLDVALPLVEPQTADDWNRRGDLHYDEGRLDLAFADYTEAKNKFSDDASARSNRGWVFYRRNDPVTALAEFNEALQRDANLLNAIWGRALVYRTQEKYTESIDELTKAILLVSDTKQHAQLLNERGNTYFAAEKFDEALADYDRSIEKNPDEPWTHSNRGETLAKLGRLEECFTALDKAISLNPNIPQFWNIAGNIWFERERYDLAANLYTRAIDVGGTDAVYYRNRGGAYRRGGQTNEAIADLEKAAEMEPSNDEYWNELGFAHHDAGRHDLAIKAFTFAIQRDENNGNYLENRAESFQHQGEYQSAVDDLTAAIAIEDTAERRFQRGNAYQALGKSDTANQDYKRATQLDDNYKLFDRRYIKLVNDSGQQLKVHLQYYTYTTDGTWKWYPSAPKGGNSAMYTFEPGESAVLYDDNWKVNASKIRLWAFSSDASWLDYRDKDLVIAPVGGYMSKDGEFELFTYNFYAAE
jgi:tetratricopeptide (TPR) repeat protein/S1-C subfamily serine protease